MSEQSLLSLQAILKRRQQQEFVGRDEPLTQFRENLALRVDDERRRFVFDIFGQGGVGKTSLLRRFFQLAESAAYACAWTDEAQEDVLAVMAYLAKQLDQYHHTFNSFNERYHLYQQKCQELAADPEAPKMPLAAFVSRTLTKASIRLGRRIPIAGVALDFVNDDEVATQISDLVTYLGRKLTNKDELRLVQDPLEVLTPLFLEGLRKAAEKSPIALFFDTYERTGDFLDQWLRAMLDGHYGEVPANIVLAIAGRDELDRNEWVPYKEMLVRLDLEPFTEQEARTYLARKGITDEHIVEVILRLSGRLPLLVATLAAEHPDDPMQIGDPSGTAVDRFLKWVEDPARRSAILDAALPRQWNKDILGVLVGEQQASAFFDWLKNMPFVKEHNDGWVYHEVVREQMLRRKHRESPQEWTDLHSQLTNYYEHCMGQLGGADDQVLDSSQGQSIFLEVLYHGLCKAPQQEIKMALNGFVTAFTIDDAFAARWAETLLQAGRDSAVPELEHWGEVLANGMGAYNENRFGEAEEMLTMLLDNNLLEDWERSVTYGWRSLVYLQTGKHMQALADLGSADLLFQTEKDDRTHQAENSAKGDAGPLPGSQHPAFLGLIVLFVMIAILLHSSKDGTEDNSAPPVEWKFDEEDVASLQEQITQMLKRRKTESG